MIHSFLPNLNAIILLSCVNNTFRLKPRNKPLTHAASTRNIVQRCLLVINMWVCFHFCPDPKLKWPWKWGSPVNFSEYKLAKRKHLCVLRKTDPYMSPSRCHRSVLCLPWTWQLCPSAAIMGRTPLQAVPQLLGMAQRHQLLGEGVGTCPVSSLCGVWEHRCFGLWITNNVQSPFACCKAGLSLSRDIKQLVAWEQVTVLRQCPAQAGWFAIPTHPSGLGTGLARAVWLCVWLPFGSPLEPAKGGTWLWPSQRPVWRDKMGNFILHTLLRCGGMWCRKQCQWAPYASTIHSTLREQNPCCTI